MLAEKQTGEGIVPTADFVDQPLLQKEGRLEVDHVPRSRRTSSAAEFRHFDVWAGEKSDTSEPPLRDRSQPKFNFACSATS